MHTKKNEAKKRAIRSFKAKLNERRTSIEKFADWLSSYFGTISFFSINVIFFVLWILINTGMVPIISAFDPFPFMLLTTIVSLEAIFLSIIVLISQNRAEKIAELREEVDLYINATAENEITKVIALLTKLLEHHNIDISNDPEIKTMMKSLSSEEIEKDLEKDLGLNR